MPPSKVSKSLTKARQREERAWHWRVRGLSQTQIALKLGEEGLGPVTQQAVAKMLARVLERIEAETEDLARQEKARQYAALSHHYRELVDAWEKSKQDEQRLSKKEIKPDEPPPGPLGTPAGPAKPGRVEETMSVAGQCGERGYLAEARATLADLRKLLGIDAPERRQVEHTGKGGGAIEHAVTAAVDVTGWDDEDLEVYERLEAKVDRGRPGRNGHAPGGPNGYGDAL